MIARHWPAQGMSGSWQSPSRSALALVVALLFCSACQTTVVTSDGRPPPPEPRTGVTPPTSAQVTNMAVRVGAKPLDTDGNGFPDLIPMEAYLFANPYRLPMYQAGAFVLTLSPGGQSSVDSAEALFRWRIEGEDLERAKIRTAIGAGYGFQLSLLDRGPGADRLPLMAVNLDSLFEPADGREPVRATGVISLQIGRRQ